MFGPDAVSTFPLIVVVASFGTDTVTPGSYHSPPMLSTKMLTTPGTAAPCWSLAAVGTVQNGGAISVSPSLNCIV